jgi:two-component system alkaline phosphatase synthesis response regulator PhoP
MAKKIMVVDDEEDILFIVKETLSREGFTIVTASGGREALKIIKKEKPDLILLDVMMPNLNGWETCKIIKEDKDTKDILVAMLTVKSEDEDKVKSLDYALADWHISKPIERAKLLRTVKWLLSTPLKRA